ncbi:MAG: nucleotide pyrophosphohydrolase [Nanoarchaeota archaeon]|nr:nucleotide pyrophosphohydrolase [Nanoarchaeota archaeon]
MNDLQKLVRAFCKKHGLESSPEHHLLDAVSELGEVAKVLLEMTDYGRKPMAHSDEINVELGDLLYSLITVANAFDVDLEGALHLSLEKYEKRLQKGSPGSENE